MRTPTYILAAAVAAGLTPAVAGATVTTGPSTTVAPYVVPVAPGTHTTSILTVDDGDVDGYTMVGIPDGMGAIRGRDGNLRVLMNHELRATQGVTRAHGQKGAFVSKWTIDRKTLAVTAGEDLIEPGVAYWRYDTGAFDLAPSSPFGAAFARFCSGTLSDRGALFNPESGNGYRGRLWFANEEDNLSGRVFAVDMRGGAQQLPRLGLASWENVIPAPNRTDTTVVMGGEDGDTDASEVWVYVGEKTSAGTPSERAGLHNGTPYVIDTLDETVGNDTEFRAKYAKGTAVPVDLAPIDWTGSIGEQEDEALGAGLSLTRVEDGHFDPRNPNDFYFLTTEGGGRAENPAQPGVSRDGGGLWRLRFADIERPELGGTLTLLLDGTEAPFLSKPDNMTIDRHGHLLIQEDPGGNAHVARIVAYKIATGQLATLAEFDRGLFAPGAPGLMTLDEESSGIIDGKDTVGDGTFLFDAQVHTSAGLSDATELVQHGQMLLLEVDSWERVFGPGRSGPTGR